MKKTIITTLILIYASVELFTWVKARLIFTLTLMNVLTPLVLTILIVTSIFTLVDIYQKWKVKQSVKRNKRRYKNWS